MFYPYIIEGGLIWMLPIVFLSYFGVALAMERTCYWTMYFWNTRNRKKKLKDFFQIPMNLNHALKSTANTSDPVTQTLHEFLKNYQNFPLHIAERKANQFAEDRLAESRQAIDWLALIANLSGTLGLAGTVVGISISFKSMSLQDSKSLALSLATALYTTVGGIILFLPAYLCVFACQKASDTLENDLDANIQNLKDVLESQEKSKLIFEKKRANSKTLSSTEQRALMFDENSVFPESQSIVNEQYPGNSQSQPVVDDDGTMLDNKSSFAHDESLCFDNSSVSDAIPTENHPPPNIPHNISTMPVQENVENIYHASSPSSIDIQNESPCYVQQDDSTSDPAIVSQYPPIPENHLNFPEPEDISLDSKILQVEKNIRQESQSKSMTIPKV